MLRTLFVVVHILYRIAEWIVYIAIGLTAAILITVLGGWKSGE